MMVASREAMAFARQAVLLRHDLEEIVPTDLNEGEHVVVLLHGLFASAGVLRPMRAYIERTTGMRTASFSYLPGPGVKALAARLSLLIERLPKSSAIHLVGHSLGGLVARYYVQSMPTSHRIVQTISLASPFRGTAQARWLPVGFARDVTPGSEVLRWLSETAHQSLIPHTSFVAPLDTIVTPAESAVFWHGEAIELAGLGHNALLFEPEVHANIARRIAAAYEAPALAASASTW